MSNSDHGCRPSDTPPELEPRIGRAVTPACGPLARFRRWVAHAELRGLMRMFNWLVRPARGEPPADTAAGDGVAREVLLTGTFHSDNWIRSHLTPLAASPYCSRLCVVSTYPIPEIPKVEAIYPPERLRRLVGDVPARLAMFTWVALRHKPDVIGGFHLLINGLVASALARLIGARSLYFCVGGPLEVLDGGVWAENRLFGLMQTPDPIVEDELIRAVDTFDNVVTMGTSAVRFFQERGVRTRFDVVPGGIDETEFHPTDAPPQTDLVLVGRLAEIKRVDVFLQAVACAATQLPTVTATVVGDGELREPLQQMARDLGVADRVRFVGQQRDVSDWLRKARVFVLTSDSEGLALSLMEAMMCGLPPVVSNVGDLGDLVSDGVNGFLVERRRPEVFAQRIVELLRDPQRWRAFSQAAHAATLRFRPAEITRRWDMILTGKPQYEHA